MDTSWTSIWNACNINIILVFLFYSLILCTLEINVITTVGLSINDYFSYANKVTLMIRKQGDSRKKESEHRQKGSSPIMGSGGNRKESCT